MRPGVRVVAIGSAALLAATIGIGVMVWNLRRDTLAEARANTANLAAMLAGQAGRALETVDIVLRDVQTLVAQNSRASAAARDIYMASDQLQARLHDYGRQLPLVQSFGVINRDGLLVNYSGYRLDHTVDLSDREYFRAVKSSDATELFIGMPVRNRADNAWTIFLGRRIADADGHFAGMVVGGLPLSYFSNMLRTLTLPAGNRLTLMRTDGMRLMRVPETEDIVGTRKQASAILNDLLAQGGGTWQATGYDGLTRLLAVEKVDGYDMAVEVGFLRDQALANWRQHAAQMAAGTVVMLAGCALLLRLLSQLVSRLENSRASMAFKNAELMRASERLRESQARLRAQSQVLHTTLETMDQGLMMIDAQNRVVLCNHQAIDMLDLPASLMARQPDFADVVALQRARGEFEATEPPVMQMLESRSLQTAPHYERRRPDGRVLEVRSATMPDGSVVRTFTDITVRRSAEDRIRHIAHHDPLTQLCNRLMFGERLQTALHAAQAGQHSLAVLYLDLDHFKQVNDVLGHAAGDLLLTEVARRMRSTVRDTDTVARMGGDEFAIIQPNADRPDSTMALARRLLDSVSAIYDLDGTEAMVGVSIGIAWYPEDGLEAEDLLRHADMALYSAKRGGRNAICCYSPSLEVTS